MQITNLTCLHWNSIADLFAFTQPTSSNTDGAKETTQICPNQMGLAPRNHPHTDTDGGPGLDPMVWGPKKAPFKLSIFTVEKNFLAHLGESARERRKLSAEISFSLLFLNPLVFSLPPVITAASLAVSVPVWAPSEPVPHSHAAGAWSHTYPVTSPGPTVLKKAPLGCFFFFFFSPKPTVPVAAPATTLP